MDRDKSDSADAPAASASAGLFAVIRRLLPGLIVATIVAVAATFLGRHYGGATMLFALLLGMAVNFLAEEDRTATGLTFASKWVLQLGVALLGVRITVDQIDQIGGWSVAVIVGAMVLTILFGVALSIVLRRGAAFGVLTGGAVAICGASAALALSLVLPRDKIGERETAFAVIGVTTLSTLAMIVYPVIVGGLDMPALQGGVFLGASIHDVAQVVGAGYGVSAETGDIATLTKLIRVAMLLPFVIVVSLAFAGATARSREPSGRRSVWTRLPAVPWFLIVFAALAAANSLHWLPADAVAILRDASVWCLVVAIAAVGVRTSLRSLAGVGGAAIGLMVGETLFLAALILLFVSV